MIAMLHLLRLLLPALIPSWRFFDTIGPSPRIEFLLLQAPHETRSDWQEFRPRPARLSVGEILKRLFWNPEWNESLFLVRCAERLMECPTDFEVQEITRHIQADRSRHDAVATPYFQFRVVVLSRKGRELRQEIVFLSPIQPLQRGADS